MRKLVRLVKRGIRTGTRVNQQLSREVYAVCCRIQTREPDVRGITNAFHPGHSASQRGMLAAAACRVNALKP